MSGPQDLAISPILLSEELRNELNAIVFANWTVKTLANADRINNFLPNSIDVVEASVTVLNYLILQANSLLRRENLNDVLDINVNVQMLRQHPQLLDKIRAASETGKFASIIDLEILQIRKPATPLTYSADKAEVNKFNESFRRPYVGSAVDGFFEYLASNNNKFSDACSRPYYGKFCSIVQSSGTGKSRLLTERNVIVLYMNIRKSSDSGFPARDEVPSRILTDGMERSREEYTARCCAFFAAMFKTLETELITLMPANLRSGSSYTPDLIMPWVDRMCDIDLMDRTKFFDKVEMEYSKILADVRKRYNVKKNSKETASGPPKKRQRTSEDDLHQTKNQTDIADSESSHLNLVGEVLLYGYGHRGLWLTTRTDEVVTPHLEGEWHLTAAYANMLKVLPQIFTTGDNPRLVIGIDEAHSLSEMSSEGFRPSHILCRAINAYSRGSSISIWVVFACTTSQVAAFSAPQPIHDSLRVAAAGQLLFPPYTHLGWDQNADALSDVSAKNVAQFDHIAGFGRPLWKSLMTVGDEDINSIMTIATQKLCKSQAFDVEIENQALAVLSQRFALDVCFGHPDAISYIEKGIASHMHVCYSTVEDRSWSFTGYPSEPLLSCAAAHLLHKNSPNLTKTLEFLKEKVDGGMFEIGQSGELTSRLMLLLAKDMYIREQSISNNPYIETKLPNKWKAELIDCQKISVVCFLEYLFGKSFWSQQDTAKTSFEHAYINFSHWVPMEGFISPGPEVSERCTAEEWTLRHWYRTSAVQCCHLQPLVDKMIPIYFDDPKLGDKDIDRVSQMFVSDKAGKYSNERKTGFITRTHHSIECSSSLPFIALLLDLNGKSKLTVSFPKKKPTRSDPGPSLRIYASGVTHDTFPFLDDHLKLQGLLSGLISKPKEPSSNERLQALVKYGSTVQVSCMRWEAQHEDHGATTEQENPDSEMHGEEPEEELEYVELNEDEGEDEDEDEGDEEGDKNDDEDRVMADDT